MNDVIRHYDRLIEEENDPFRDPPVLRAYMAKWDGQPFWDALHVNDQDEVLEIGIGTGRLAARVAPHCRRLMGIDISPKTVERAKINLADKDNLELICADFLSYPFAQTFDLVYSSLTFMHFEDKEAAVAKVTALLKPGGRAVISLDKNREDSIDTGSGKIKVYPDCAQTLCRLLARNGLAVEDPIETAFAWIVSAKNHSK